MGVEGKLAFAAFALRYYIHSNTISYCGVSANHNQQPKRA